jgi:hypothetical protein
MENRACRLAVAALAAGAALAGGPSPAAAEPEGWRALSQRIAEPWPAIQLADGRYPDYMIRLAPHPRRDRYGEAFLGYALVQNGLRDGDQRMIDTGLRSLAYAAAERERNFEIATFKNMALASAYNLVRERLPDHPLFVQSRAAWEERMRHSRLTRIGPGRPITNKVLVAAVEVLELERTGLSSDDPRSILRDAAGHVRLVRRLLGRDLPRLAGRFDRGSGIGTAAMLGDYPALPLSYHALSIGFLGRAVELLGGRASSATRRLLVQAARASSFLTAPDGDLSYFGRSQEQAWTQSVTAYGAEVAATLAPRDALRMRALADRTVERLARAYSVGGEGLLITPAVSADLGAGVRGMDVYAAASPYNGLTLVGLNWALERAGERGPASAGIPADSPGEFRLGRGPGEFVTVRSGDVWFAVKRSPAGIRDLRNDFGLVALKVRGGDGTWHDLMRLRPRVERADSAGPVLVRSGPDGLPEGRSLSADERGRVRVVADFRTTAGRALRTGVPFAFVPLARGIRVKLPVRDRDTYELSAFFPQDADPPRAESGLVRDGRQEVSFDQPGTVRFEQGYSSGLDPRLVRVRIRLAVRRGSLTIEFTAP